MSEKACPSCGKRFPDHLLHEMEIGDARGIRREVKCPICALKLINAIHGLPPATPFNGPKAAKAHDEAVKWLKTSRQESAK